MSTFPSSSKESDVYADYLLPINQINSELNLELYEASAKGDKGRVRKALNDGAKPNFFNISQEQKTPLHIATENGCLDVVKLLLDNGAMIDLMVVASNDTALGIAGDRGDASVVKILIASIPLPNLNHQNTYGNTALHASIRKGSIEASRLLINAGSHVNLANHKGSTALHFLCYTDRISSSEASKQTIELAKLLVSSMADVNARDHKGMTPILVCCVSGRMDLITFLIANGADKAAKDNLGKDCYEVAVFYKHEHLYQFFSQDSPKNRFNYK
mmetsp:Transcript_12638/g.12273  ORF Transcript_12638/g.12273 Transcript_12638/m.12273 type:complete len:273 (+) Transcript_12638:139-957(+)